MDSARSLDSRNIATTLCFNTSSTLGHRDLIVKTITCYKIHFLIQALPKSTYRSYLTYAHMDHVTNEYVRFNLLSDNKILFPLWFTRYAAAGGSVVFTPWRAAPHRL